MKPHKKIDKMMYLNENPHKGFRFILTSQLGQPVISFLGAPSIVSLLIG